MTLALVFLLSSLGQPTGAVESAGKPSTCCIRWERDFDEALKKARAGGKPLMIDFWADWCGWCHRLDETTYVDPQVVKMASDFVAVKLDTEAGAKQAAVALRYEVSSLPTIAFVSPSGRQLLKVSGFQGPGQFPATLEIAKQTAQRVMAWEAALDRNVRDAEALVNLGVHLFEQAFYEESGGLLARAAQADSERPASERKKTRMLLGTMRNYDRKYAEAETVLKEGLALKPAGDYDPKILYILGRTYARWGKDAEARAAFQQVVDSNATTLVAQKAREALRALDRQK